MKNYSSISFAKTSFFTSFFFIQNCAYHLADNDEFIGLHSDIGEADVVGANAHIRQLKKEMWPICRNSRGIPGDARGIWWGEDRPSLLLLYSLAITQNKLENKPGCTRNTANCWMIHRKSIDILRSNLNGKHEGRRNPWKNWGLNGKKTNKNDSESVNIAMKLYFGEKSIICRKDEIMLMCAKETIFKVSWWTLWSASSTEWFPEWNI